MPVTTTSAVVHIAPVVINTFFTHGKRKAKKFKDGRQEEDSKDNIFYDQAFNIVKAFILLGTQNTIESLQAFTNTHVPSPYWAAVAPVQIPMSSCNSAANVLIGWFGPKELKHVVGGERWWQVRGMDGIDAEWITQTKYLGPPIDKVHAHKQKLAAHEKDILRMEHLETVMLYVHGGGYFWGSINTHRYQIIRYAQKIKGRAFAMNYRKAPQYPWPCPLQDVIAAYLYLIRPPHNALHKPVPPSKIVFAGDSAGGGLCISVLTVLRDMNVPMPAGAVLISPWVDLTHSFPSILQNTKTDFAPPHGFLAKPSASWPVDPLPPGDGRVILSRSNPPPDPGHADTLNPTKHRMLGVDNRTDITATGEKVRTQREMLNDIDHSPELKSDTLTGVWRKDVKVRPQPTSSNPTNAKEDDDYDLDLWEPKPPKVLMDDSNAVPLELRSQIQLYATTEQLTHPIVSPVLQGSLGNLPPLYILGGDDEVLRDEIIYLAHRAAHPAQYPARNGTLRDGRRQKENAEKYTTPTKVHLQIFDGMCHVLTVFTFTSSAKYAYRSIGEFVKHVSQHDDKYLDHKPFPELSRLSPENRQAVKSKGKSTSTPKSERQTPAAVVGNNFARNTDEVAEESRSKPKTVPQPLRISCSDRPKQCGDVSESRMIRERVDIHGVTRLMETPEDLQALKLQPEQVGIIKEGPVKRWLKGQEVWDRRYKHNAERAIKRRSKFEAKAKKMLELACAQGLLVSQDITSSRSLTVSPGQAGGIQQDRRWGPLDLECEHPPPTAIAKRRDTPEALALLKKSIYHTAPVTHNMVPKLQRSDASRPPRQSVSEQQVRTRIAPRMHGLRLWDRIDRYLGKRTSKQKGTPE